ncbi:MAG: phenylphosphate carboxylase subunit delta [Lysobacterales bacterium]|nr:phenylphosphate carboxylase subunit delta [Xanthomonadales bacterium]
MSTPEAQLAKRASAIRIVGFDVDGVLTDGRLLYGNDGTEAKAFHVHDGLGLKLLQQAGIITVVISARASAATERRLSELGVAHVHLGVRDKLPLFEQIARDQGLGWLDAAYMGDDLPDLGILSRVHLPATVAEAAPEVLDRALWVASRPAGAGAVRQFAEFLLRSQGKFEALLAPYLSGVP